MPDAEAAVEREQNADEQAEAVPAHRTDVVAKLIADDRKIAERRVDDATLEIGIAVQHISEHGHQHEEHREQTEEGVEGDPSRQRTALVVAELLEHTHHEARRPVFALIS